MKKPQLDDYQLFYLEIPRTESDPLNDISTEIQDEHNLPGYNEFQGLSDEQVSEIARDSLADCEDNANKQDSPIAFAERDN